MVDHYGVILRSYLCSCLDRRLNLWSLAPAFPPAETVISARESVSVPPGEPTAADECPAACPPL